MALPTFSAGRRLRASELAALVSVLTGFTRSNKGTCTAALTLTTTATDVVGCSVNATTANANAYAVVTASVQFSVTVVGAVTLACGLVVDGVSQAAQGTIRDSADQVHDRHHSYIWRVPLSAGAHTFKLQGSKSGAASTSTITNTAGTNLMVEIFDLP